MMYQQEIQFFWPLTEQVPLDLDYSRCSSLDKVLSYEGGTGITYAAQGNWLVTSTTDIQASTLIVSKPSDIAGYFSIGPLKIGMEKKPNFVQVTFLKLLGFDWKKL